MSRLARRVAFQVALEETYGGGLPSGMGWADAVQVLPRTRPAHRPIAMNEKRELYTPWLGASDEIPGPQLQEVTVEVELSPSGTAGTPPPWATLMRGCQWAQTVVAGTRVLLTPVSAPGESLVMRYWADGSAWISRGVRGTVELFVEAFKIPRARFRFQGFDTNLVTAGPSQPATPYAAWKTPILPMSSNSGDIRLGCTLSGHTLSGGTAYPSKGFSLSMGDDLKYDATLSAEKVVIAERNPTGKMILELTPAQDATWRTEMRNSVETTFGWRVGATAGNSITFFGRRLQRQTAEHTDDLGLLRTETKFGLILDKDDPNDDWMTIVVH